MRITRMVAAAALCASVVVGSAGVAAAAPEPENRPALAVRGDDRGVGYEVALSDDSRSAVGTLTAGRFLATWDAETVAVTDDSGHLLANLPLRFDLAGTRVELAPVIDEAGRRLTLTPVGESAGPLREIDAQQRLFDIVQPHLAAVGTGAAIGAALGFVIGFPLGLFVLDFITVPITTVLGGALGAVAGLYASGGQPAVDAATAALTEMVTGAGESPR
ncbi:hypothetical protein ACWDSJ_08710 [Nocardia sp. NPDC003482]